MQPTLENLRLDFDGCSLISDNAVQGLAGALEGMRLTHLVVDFGVNELLRLNDGAICSLVSALVPMESLQQIMLGIGRCPAAHPSSVVLPQIESFLDRPGRNVAFW